MKTLLTLAASLLFATCAHAQAPAGAPAGATGQCKDGTYSTAAHKMGSCRGHNGVKDWYAADAASTGATPSRSTNSSMNSSMKAEKTAAQPMPAGSAPAGSTGLCKDGTYATSSVKMMACRGHRGIQDWYAASATKSNSPMTNSGAGQMPNSQSQSMPANQPAAQSTATSQSTSSTQSSTPRGKRASPSSMTPAPGGGPGMVWVNTSTKVYHCPGTEFYGKTKSGSYMSEADAKAQGGRADHNKPCK